MFVFISINLLTTCLLSVVEFKLSLASQKSGDHSLATGVGEVGCIGIAQLPAGGVCCSLCHVTHRSPVEVQVHFHKPRGLVASTTLYQADLRVVWYSINQN